MREAGAGRAVARPRRALRPTRLPISRRPIVAPSPDYYNARPMRLLVSVVDAAEARVAAAAGADVIDVKDPSLGALGEAAPHVVRAVREATPLHLPVSAALGDGPFTPAVAAGLAEGAAGSGAAFVKLGLRHTSLAEAAATLRAARAGLPPGVRLVVAGFADSARAGSPAPADLPELAAAAGAEGCLLDTAVKDGRGLFHWLDETELREFVAGVPRARAVLRARRVAARRGSRRALARSAPISSACAAPPAPATGSAGASTPRACARSSRRAISPRRSPSRGGVLSSRVTTSVPSVRPVARSSRHALGPRAPDDPARDGRIERPREVRIHHAGKLVQGHLTHEALPAPRSAPRREEAVHVLHEHEAAGLRARAPPRRRSSPR